MKCKVLLGEGLEVFGVVTEKWLRIVTSRACKSESQ